MERIRLYITGSVASGKSTLARRISKITGIPCCHLDEVVYEKNPADPCGNCKRSAEQRDAIFQGIVSQPHYIIEDAGRECFEQGMAQADQIILLEIPLLIRQKRIVLRWLKQNLGLERCIYKPRFKMLKAMFRWAKNYDTGADGTKKLAAQYQDKLTVLHNNRELAVYLKGIRPPLRP